MKIVYFENGRKFLVKDTSKDFHTKDGIVKKSDFKKKKGKTNIGKDFIIFDPSFIDRYKRLKRTAQIILPKDIGFIISECGLGKESVVFDAGSGSGGVACFLANVVKKVYTFDNDKRHIICTKDNVKMLDLKNVDVIERDVYEKGFGKKNADCIILDLKEPWRCIDHCRKALKSGGFLVVYTPHITQALQFINENKEKEVFIPLRTIEVFEREWKLTGKIARPEFVPLGHSAFLGFFRGR
ncbi:MAG: methyltransferase domain-containing protein [Nanoarchaeota archaeon]|nr:methyltransferase domain-containing protein [Nanoarchaeota archaeon]